MNFLHENGVGVDFLSDVEFFVQFVDDKCELCHKYQKINSMIYIPNKLLDIFIHVVFNIT